MLQKKFFKYCLFMGLICLSAFFVINLNKHQNKYSYTHVQHNNDECIVTDNNSENCCIQLEVDDDISATSHENISNASYSNPTYTAYSKGAKNVNVMFNFINYTGDTTNHFTLTEINSIMSNFTKNVNAYFERMSQGFVSIDIDYVCSIAPASYDYYHSKTSSNYSIENSIFTNATKAKLDYSGNVKQFKFSNYHFRVNAFAGNSGEWNTFLWAHAYSDLSLILMTESQMKVGTLCHEMLHTFGVKDLYSYTTYNGTQNFSAQYIDMMGSSGENTSTNAYFRNKIGWIDKSIYNDAQKTAIEEIPSRQRGSLTLDIYANCTNDYSQTIAYKFGENDDNDEFFVVEYKVRGYDSVFDDSLYSSAVIVYRVNPNATRGNVYGNDGTDYNEVIFMGDFSNDITQYDYHLSCLLTENDVYGNKNSSSTTSLVYSSGMGKSKLFNGVNSNITIAIDSIKAEYATITITFAEEKIDLDLTNTGWDYSNAFTYNGTSYAVGITNVPSNLDITYSGTFTSSNAGNYTVTAILVYDEYIYNLINDNFVKTLHWQIIPANLTIKVDNKSSPYGSALLDLTYSITSGKVYDNDNINLHISKSGGTNAGKYTISCTTNNDNYNFTIINGTYTITPKVIEINVFDQTFSAEEFMGIDQTKFQILASSDNILSGDIVNIHLNALDLDNSREGDYVISATTDNSNYSLVVNEGTLHINPPAGSAPNQPEAVNNAVIILWTSIISIAVISISGTILAVRRRRKKLARWERYW